MSMEVYSSIPLLLVDGVQEFTFILKLNPSTESFRLEGTHIKRNISIGNRMFNKLFQLIRNEYGQTLGRIYYDDEQMNKGHASTVDHDHFRFLVKEENDIEVQIEKQSEPGKIFKAFIQLKNSNPGERIAHLKALMPTVLAALIFTKEFYLKGLTYVS